MADGSLHKSIDNFTLFEVMKSAIDSTDQPFTNKVLEQMFEVINHNFDFCKKITGSAQVSFCSVGYCGGGANHPWVYPSLLLLLK
jgi:hypothetical protein